MNTFKTKDNGGVEDLLTVRVSLDDLFIKYLLSH